MRIPPNSQWTQPNTSDLFGSLAATKNVNLDEEGYIKLSSRMASVMSEDLDSSFDLPIAIGRTNEDDFITVTEDDAFTGTVSPTDISFTEDTSSGVPASFSQYAWGAFWQNRWYAADTDDLYWKALNTGTYTDIANLTSGVPHPIEVFRNRNTLCVGNGNKVVQYATDHSTSTELTLPSDFQVIGLAYSGYRMGIITRLSPTIAGQNQDAYFFVWDGASTSADAGVPIGSDMAAGIAAYKGTWAIVSRTGELIAFNGGGFEQLAAFPFYFKGVTWGDFTNRVGKGVNMLVEGDVIYINLALNMDQYGRKLEIPLPYCPSGIWCYDPKVGLYHRYSPSISTLAKIFCQQADINTTTNVITRNTGTVPSTGSPVRYTAFGSSAIGGLTIRQDYWCIKLTSTTFKLANSYEEAMAGVAIDLTSDGGGTHNFVGLDLLDYGATRISEAGGTALMGIQSQVYDHLIAGAELYDHDNTGDLNHLLVTVPGFENRGYFMTPKILASQVEEDYQRLILPFRPLADGDSIIVKRKTKELAGLPVTSDQAGAQCNWTGQSGFFVTADLSDVKAAFDAGHEIECEILSGAGAGVIEKVQHIDVSSGTYAVTLENPVHGAASGRYSDVQFDNFETVMTIDNTVTSNDLGYAVVPVDASGKWLIMKVELRGVEVAVEPLQLQTKPKSLTA